MLSRWRKFQQNINGIKDLKATNTPKKVVIVNKQFYDDFLNWISCKRLKPPQNLNTEYFFTENKLKSDMKRGTDYEIISSNLWNDLIKQFGSHPKIEAILIKAPSDGTDTILLQHQDCLEFHIYYPKKVPSTDLFTISMMPIQYFSHPNWLLKDVKKQICTMYDLEPSLFAITSHNRTMYQFQRIGETLQMSQVHKLYKNELDVRQNKLKNANDYNSSNDQRSLRMHKNPINLKVSQKVESSNFLNTTVSDNQRTFNFRFAPMPVGLNNLGNTCFFNAAVQCLVRVMPLTEFVMSDGFTSQINRSNVRSSGGLIALSYRRLIECLCRGPPSMPRDPSELRRAVVSRYKQFANFGQHDSQELLCSLLDGLHEDMNQSAAVGGRLAPVFVSREPDCWDNHLSRNSSPIVDMFHGILYSSITCPSCSHEEKVREPFVFLPLDVPRKFGSVKLENCLKKFSRKESLDWRNKWQCEKCGKKVCASKMIGVEKCPKKVLIIQLKRFSGDGIFSLKIDTNVDYPDVIDASMFTKNDRGSFRLIGAVFHMGGMGYGHYIAAAIDPRSNEWFLFNDSTARRIERSEAHDKRAYILFYERQE